MGRAILILTFLFLAIVVQAEISPPVLVNREANTWPQPPAGVVIELDSPTSTTFSLFVPEGMVLGDDGQATLTVHFHGAAWFIRQEHARRGARHPLLVANAKGGDAVYETDMMQPGLFASLLEQTEKHLGARVGTVELSAFSAGYAGVRGVLRMEEFEPLVARVMLNDSVYVGDGPDSNPPDDRKPRGGADGIQPFIDYARKAAAGERTLLMEFSSTPSLRSVGPMDCARTVMEALDISAVDVALDSIPAARSTADYQMMWRAAKGNAHFWCYRAAEKPIHLAHLRNQADMWRALDGRQRLDLMPLMTPRAIKPSEPPFETIALDLGIAGDSALFLPANYNVAADGAVELTIHFHGATWFVIQEHQRRGNGDPIVALELGQGSSVYAKPFEDPLLFRRLLDAVAEELKKRGGPPETHIDSVNITSFSAGYGAVREIVKSPEHVALLKRIVLADSSYGSLNESHLAQDKRVVASEHVEPWLEIARLAQGGGKTLLMMTSDIAPDTYAGTHEVARAVAEALQLEIKPIPADSCPAAESGLAYPLHTRADSGGFHWWAYGGNDAVVHMTIARHIADAWETLDQLGDP